MQRTRPVVLGPASSRVSMAKAALAAGRAGIIALLLSGATASHAEDRTTLSFMGGVMTENKIDVLYNWPELEFADNYLAGVVFGRDRSLAYEHWSAGYELHLNQHFGDDTYTEIIAAGVARYAPPNPWLSVLQSYAIGLGVSHVSETPEVEVRIKGQSQRTTVYMALETAFDVGRQNSEVFFRVHHRSDGYGLFSTDMSSNAFVIGFRKEIGRR